MRRLSIPRALLAATAVLLAVAIFIIVVHPYFNVSNSTAADWMATLLLVIVLASGTTAARGRIVFHSSPTVFSQPQPLPVMARNRIRRI